MTPAEKHQWLVKQATERYIDTFLKVFKHEAQGGRVPGIVEPSKAELLAFFNKETTPEYWATLRAADPQEAQSQIDQWTALEGRDNGNHARTSAPDRRGY